MPYFCIGDQSFEGLFPGEFSSGRVDLLKPSGQCSQDKIISSLLRKKEIVSTDNYIRAWKRRSNFLKQSLHRRSAFCLRQLNYLGAAVRVQKVRCANIVYATS